MLHLWMFEMFLALLHGFLLRLNGNYLSPSFTLDQMDGEFLLQQFLFIRGDVINLSLWLASDPVRISQAAGSGTCLSVARGS
jgi:hypothetical protein